MIVLGTQISADPPAMRGTSGQVSADNAKLKIIDLRSSASNFSVVKVKSHNR